MTKRPFDYFGIFSLFPVACVFLVLELFTTKRKRIASILPCLLTFYVPCNCLASTCIDEAVINRSANVTLTGRYIIDKSIQILN